MRKRKRAMLAVAAVEQFKTERDRYEQEHRPRYTAQFTQWDDGSVRWTIWDANPDLSYAVEGFLVPYAMGNEPTTTEAGRVAAEWCLAAVKGEQE